MSYYISIEFDGIELYGDSYTYNVSDMYRKAINKMVEFRNGVCQVEGINVLNGIDCVSASSILEHAIQYFKTNKEEIEKLNPPNGWGNYDGALQVLENLYAECITRNSNCFVYIC